MIRILVQEMALFLSPFLLYAIVLVLQRKHVLDLQHWSRSAAWLAMAGLLLVIGGFVYAGLFGKQNTGAYVPPHMEDGKLVPGQFK
ncbi:DUF6111 family protein [Enterovirga rhinocerotis]|uniref:Uncharacterized protein n=1 Tax=Enterovirga rhinocerotis TaxID=1339210 RepID=A0A4R7C8Y0_9HYPH|nr:DUF6111 family protein [Enterovirga rhinocerotis]TDR93336.1 hypothetical protein EV668_0594 [Enterovirga rhinocerotis]